MPFEIGRAFSPEAIAAVQRQQESARQFALEQQRFSIARDSSGNRGDKGLDRQLKMEQIRSEAEGRDLRRTLALSEDDRARSKMGLDADQFNRQLELNRSNIEGDAEARKAQIDLSREAGGRDERKMAADVANNDEQQKIARERIAANLDINGERIGLGRDKLGAQVGHWTAQELNAAKRTEVYAKNTLFNQGLSTRRLEENKIERAARLDFDKRKNEFDEKARMQEHDRRVKWDTTRAEEIKFNSENAKAQMALNEAKFFEEKHMNEFRSLNLMADTDKLIASTELTKEQAKKIVLDAGWDKQKNATAWMRTLIMEYAAVADADKNNPPEQIEEAYDNMTRFGALLKAHDAKLFTTVMNATKAPQAVAAASNDPLASDMTEPGDLFSVPDAGAAKPKAKGKPMSDEEYFADYMKKRGPSAPAAPSQTSVNAAPPGREMDLSRSAPTRDPGDQVVPGRYPSPEGPRGRTLNMSQAAADAASRMLIGNQSPPPPGYKAPQIPGFR